MENNENKPLESDVVVEKPVRARRSSVKVDDKPGAIGLDKTLMGFLAFSVVINILLFIHINSLTNQISTLTGVVSGIGSQSRNVVSNPQTVTSMSDTSTTIPGKVELVVITDKRCKGCDTTSLIGSLTQLFGSSLDYKVYDYSDSNAQSLLKSTGLKLLPVALFTSSVTSSPSYSAVGSYLKPAGSYLSLAIGAEFDPTCYDSSGAALCSDTRCSPLLECRDIKKNTLDLFVMSHCPYGIQAMNSMKEVLGALKNITFNLHYIADESGGVFNSLHGQSEVDDDIRELCAMKYYPTNYKWFDFVSCRNKDTSAEWTACVTSNGMDLSKIKACAEGQEGKDLLSSDIKIATALKVSASPTFLANNQHMYNAITATDIQKQICGYNAGMIGCGATLNSTASTSTGSCAT